MLARPIDAGQECIHDRPTVPHQTGGVVGERDKRSAEIITCAQFLDRSFFHRTTFWSRHVFTFSIRSVRVQTRHSCQRAMTRNS